MNLHYAPITDPRHTGVAFDQPAAAPQPPRPRRKLGRQSAADLLRKELPPVRYVVPGYIAEGLTVLAGRPKLGKSWLALDLAVAVATGGAALGSIRVEQGDVLYLALEDNERRLQKRLMQLLPPFRDAGAACCRDGVSPPGPGWHRSRPGVDRERPLPSADRGGRVQQGPA